MAEAATLLTWNLERKKPETPTGSAALAFLHTLTPDVMVLTEARTSIPHDGAHLASSTRSKGTYGDDERKVVLWSKAPWREVDDIGDPELPEGRFVAGLTDTPIGTIRVVGICIPWHMAGVAYGARDQKPWQKHIRFLEVLPQVLASYTEPTVVAGDFNQFVPRTWGSKHAGEALEAAFSHLDVVTRGTPPGCERAGIDHIALSRALRSERRWGWPSVQDGIRCSDHDGAGSEVALA